MMSENCGRSYLCLDCPLTGTIAGAVEAVRTVETSYKDISGEHNVAATVLIGENFGMSHPAVLPDSVQSEDIFVNINDCERPTDTANIVQKFLGRQQLACTALRSKGISDPMSVTVALAGVSALLPEVAEMRAAIEQIDLLGE